MITPVNHESDAPINEAMDASAFRNLINKQYAGAVAFKDGTTIGFVASGGGRYILFKNDNDTKGQIISSEDAIKHYEARKNQIKPAEAPNKYASYYDEPFIEFLKSCDPKDPIQIKFDHNSSVPGFNGRVVQVTWHYVNHIVRQITKDPKYGYEVTLSKPRGVR